MKIRHVDHIGINVDDLEAAKVFFTDLGFTVMGVSTMAGKLLDEVTGLKGARTELNYAPSSRWSIKHRGS